MRVVYFTRRPNPNYYFSMEKSFEASRKRLPDDVQSSMVTCRYFSQGLWKRLANIADVAFRQGEVNHIIGDVHYLALSLRKRKTVLTIHDCVFESRGSRVKRWLFRWLWYIIPVHRVAVVTVVSQFTKERLLVHVKCDPDKIRVVPTCISESFHRIDRPFRSDCPTILQVGTLPNKNLDRLAKALTGISCRLRIIGKLTPEQQAMLETSGIDFTHVFGLSEEALLQEYADCDLVTFVSTYEGFGMPIVEANTVGRPVVTSTVASMPEIAGDAACLIDPYDVDSIREGLLKVIHDESYRQTLVQNGYQNCLRFRAQDVALQYTEIYRELIGSPAPAVVTAR